MDSNNPFKYILTIRIFISIALVFISFLSYSQSYYWEDLSEQEQKKRIASCNNEDIIAFYNGSFVPTDDERTFTLLDNLTSSSKTDLPLFFHTFNLILSSSDGALAEPMGDYCLRILPSYPDYIIKYFALYNEALLKKYAAHMGFELSFYNDATEYQALKKKLDAVSIHDKSIEKQVKDLIAGIDEAIQEMKE